MNMKFNSDGSESPSQWEAAGPSGMSDAVNFDSTAASIADLYGGLNLPSGLDLATRLDQIKAAENPLLEAAKPLLLALAQMRRLRLGGAKEVGSLQSMLEREVIEMTQLCHRANLRREHVVAASFCLCTALDEAANSTSWGGAGQGQAGLWAEHLLAVRFHQDNSGGKKFFLLAGRLSAEPQAHLDLLQLMVQLLALGFEGQYANDPQGPRHIEAIRQSLLNLVAGARDPVARDLSPRWRGAVAGKMGWLRSMPVWVTASILSLLVLGLFAWYKYRLALDGQQLVQQIAAIGKLSPPPKPAFKLRLAELLKDEIARGMVVVDEDAQHSAVTFRSDDMFAPAQATVNSKVMPLLGKVAKEIAKVQGHVKVTGHSDATPITSAKFASNQALSEARARGVADVLSAAGVESTRVEVIGKGDTEPVSTGRAAADLARNRRVQLVVTE